MRAGGADRRQAGRVACSRPCCQPRRRRLKASDSDSPHPFASISRQGAGSGPGHARLPMGTEESGSRGRCGWRIACHGRYGVDPSREGSVCSTAATPRLASDRTTSSSAHAPTRYWTRGTSETALLAGAISVLGSGYQTPKQSGKVGAQKWQSQNQSAEISRTSTGGFVSSHSRGRGFESLTLHHLQSRGVTRQATDSVAYCRVRRAGGRGVHGPASGLSASPSRGLMP
jgi:hypothetical protein